MSETDFELLSSGRLGGRGDRISDLDKKRLYLSLGAIFSIGVASSLVYLAVNPSALHCAGTSTQKKPVCREAPVILDYSYDPVIAEIYAFSNDTLVTQNHTKNTHTDTRTNHKHLVPDTSHTYSCFGSGEHRHCHWVTHHGVRTEDDDDVTRGPVWKKEIIPNSWHETKKYEETVCPSDLNDDTSRHLGSSSHTYDATDDDPWPPERADPVRTLVSTTEQPRCDDGSCSVIPVSYNQSDIPNFNYSGDCTPDGSKYNQPPAVQVAPPVQLCGTPIKVRWALSTDPSQYKSDRDICIRDQDNVSVVKGLCISFAVLFIGASICLLKELFDNSSCKNYKRSISSPWQLYQSYYDKNKAVRIEKLKQVYANLLSGEMSLPEGLEIQELQCNIEHSGELMFEPVSICLDGVWSNYAYERSAITKWLDTGDQTGSYKDPLTAQVYAERPQTRVNQTIKVHLDNLVNQLDTMNENPFACKLGSSLNGGQGLDRGLLSAPIPACAV